MFLRSRNSLIYRHGWVLMMAIAIQWLMCAPAYAVQWNTTAGIQSRVTAQSNTDNSDSTETIERSSETLLGLSPYFLIGGKSRSFDISARLGVDSVYSEGDGSSTTRPSVTVGSQYTVVPKKATIAAFVSAGRVLESRSRSAEEFLGEVNTDRSQYDFSVFSSANANYWQATTINLSHKYSYTDFSDDEQPSSQTHLVQAASRSSLQGGRSLLTTNTSYQTSHIDGNGTFNYGESSIGLGLPLNSQKTLVSVLVGRDWVDVQASSEDLDGYFWGLGLQWAPNDQLALNAGYSQRRYGKSPSLQATWTGRRNSLSIEWSRLSALQRAQISSNGFATSFTSDSDQESSAQVADPSVSSVLMGGQSSLSPLLDDIQSIDDRFQLTHRLQGRVSSLSTTIGVSTRSSIFSSESTDSTLRYASAAIQRTLSRTASATMSYRTARSDNNIGTDDSSSSSFQLSIQWSFL